MSIERSSGLVVLSIAVALLGLAAPAGAVTVMDQIGDPAELTATSYRSVDYVNPVLSDCDVVVIDDFQVAGPGTVTQVDAVMTEAATRFITPLTFQSLTGRPVFTTMWGALDAALGEGAILPTHVIHVGLVEAADLLVILSDVDGLHNSAPVPGAPKPPLIELV